MARFQETFQQLPHDAEVSEQIILTARLLSPNDILVTKQIHAEDVCVSERRWKLAWVCQTTAAVSNYSLP